MWTFFSFFIVLKGQFIQITKKTHSFKISFCMKLFHSDWTVQYKEWHFLCGAQSTNIFFNRSDVILAILNSWHTSRFSRSFYYQRFKYKMIKKKNCWLSVRTWGIFLPRFLPPGSRAKPLHSTFNPNVIGIILLSPHSPPAVLLILLVLKKRNSLPKFTTPLSHRITRNVKVPLFMLLTFSSALGKWGVGVGAFFVWPSR